MYSSKLYNQFIIIILCLFTHRHGGKPTIVTTVRVCQLKRAVGILKYLIQ